MVVDGGRGSSGGLIGSQPAVENTAANKRPSVKTTDRPPDPLLRLFPPSNGYFLLLGKEEKEDRQTGGEENDISAASLAVSIIYHDIAS